MPGPPPKDPSLRQRRNKTATAAKLSLAPNGVDVPELPERVRVDEETGEVCPIAWHPRTSEWWERVWASPMAAEWLDADVPGLELVAELWDAFYSATSASDRVKLSSELRLQEARFGLAPMDRRRLQWEVERGEDAAERGRKRRRRPAEGDSAPAPTPEADPRAFLSAV